MDDKETDKHEDLLDALRRSEERLRVTMESAVDFAIITTDPNRLIEEWNTGAERIFGFTAEEVKGQSADIIFTPEDRVAGMPEKEVQTAVEKGYAEDERWHIRRDGTRIFMSGVMRPIYNPQLTGFVKIARNITQQKLLEQQKDDFIGIASHELKTPITSIRIYSEILQESLEESNDKNNASIIKKLNTQVDRLHQLVNDLLDTTRLVEGKIMLYPQQFDLHDLVEEKIEDIRQISKKHSFDAKCTGSVLITADRDRIGQVMTNLLSNAVKYSPNGGEIVISCERTETFAKITVKDNGIGISRDMLSKVFDRFFRVGGSVMNTYPGMGLGLYISAEIIHRHGGTISVESQEGKGSVFYFTLPLV